MKKYAGYSPIFSSANGAGRAIYVLNGSAEAFKKILKNYRSNYHLTTMFRQIVSLNADANRGVSLNRAGDVRSFFLNVILTMFQV